MVYCARGTEVSIGREDSDMNFPDDQYLSSKHATVRLDGDNFYLADKGSRNGSFVRIVGEQQLANGDYIFMGTPATSWWRLQNDCLPKMRKRQPGTTTSFVLAVELS